MGKGDFLDPKTFQATSPTLGVGSTTVPPSHSDFLNAISLTAGDPDRAQALTGFTVVPPTLALGSKPAVHGHGDVGDVLGSSQNSDTGTGVYALIAFETVAGTLGLGTVSAPHGHGDISDVGDASLTHGSTEGAGPSGLITWEIVSPTLGLGTTHTPQQYGDLGEIYGTLGNAVEGLTWEAVTPTLSTGIVAPVTGHGDVEAVMPFTGYSPGSQTWIEGLSSPVLTGAINGFSSSVSLNWTSIGTHSLYTVYRSVNGGAFSVYATGVNALSYTDTGVIGTNTYSYYVASTLPFLVSNIVNPYSGVVAPVLSYVVVSQGISLSWTGIGIPATYSLYRSINGGAFSLYQSALSALSYVDSALVRGNTYSYYVQSTFPIETSNTVSNITGTVIDTYIIVGTFTWSKRSGAYQVSGVCIGGGGGAGAGSIQDSGTPGGGSGGSGGGFASFVNVPASYFASTESIVVGLGGAGNPNTTVTGQQAQSGGLSSIGVLAISNGGVGGRTNPLGGGGVAGGTATCSLPGAYTEQGGSSGDGSSGIGVNPGGSTTLAPGGGAGGAGGTSGSAGAGGSVGALAGGAGGANAFSGIVNDPNPLSAGDGGNGQNGVGVSSGSGGGAGGSATYGSFGAGPLHAGNGGNGGGYGAGGGGGNSGHGSSNPSTSTGANGGNATQGAVQITTYFW